MGGRGQRRGREISFGPVSCPSREYEEKIQFEEYFCDTSVCSRSHGRGQDHLARNNEWD